MQVDANLVSYAEKVSAMLPLGHGSLRISHITDLTWMMKLLVGLTTSPLPKLQPRYINSELRK